MYTGSVPKAAGLNLSCPDEATKEDPFARVRWLESQLAYRLPIATEPFRSEEEDFKVNPSQTALSRSVLLDRFTKAALCGKVLLPAR